jgi:hypothetical protein
MVDSTSFIITNIDIWLEPFSWTFLIRKKKKLRGRGDHFRFGSVFNYKKQPNRFFFFEKTNRNRVKPTGFGPVRFGSWFQKTEKTYMLIFLLELVSKMPFQGNVIRHYVQRKESLSFFFFYYFYLEARLYSSRLLAHIIL